MNVDKAGSSMEVSKSAEFNCRFIAALERKDIAMIKDWRNRQMMILRQSKPLTDTDQEEWYRNLSRDDSQIVFGLRFNEGESDHLVGYCALVRMDSISKRAELSFLVNPTRAESKDLYKNDMISALALLCRYGFEEIQLHKIYTETFEFRKNHISILEDFGFVKEGVLRSHQYKSGKFLDSVLHSMLDVEWKSIRERWFDGHQ